jgi:hypothetical protein
MRRVDVIELNEGIRDVVDVDLAHLSGSPYSRPGVHTTIGDGRAVLRSRDTRYDVIHVGFTDTLSADSAQGFALAENNLYTLEAFDEYWDHLTPGGVLNVSRLRELVGEEALRVTVLTLASLERRGFDDPLRHVVVLRGVDLFGAEFGTVLARENPWTDAELAEIRELARERSGSEARRTGAEPVVLLAPDGEAVGEWAELRDASSVDAFCASYRVDVCAPTDDRPFFFNMRRPSQIFTSAERIDDTDPVRILVLTAAILLVLAAAGFALPLALGRRTVTRPSATSLVYFAAIGFGFLLLEIVLVQRFVLFLGFPTYALSVVLFALLLFTGVGSQLAARATRHRLRLGQALTLAAALVVTGAFGLAPVLDALIDLPFGARVAVTVALLAPVGLVLGVAMPIGLTRFAALHPDGVAYAWAVNGLASILASVLGVVAALFVGFRVTMLLAAACYLLALAHVVVGRWPAEQRRAGTLPTPSYTGAPGGRS